MCNVFRKGESSASCQSAWWSVVANLVMIVKSILVLLTLVVNKQHSYVLMTAEMGTNNSEQ